MILFVHMGFQEALISHQNKNKQKTGQRGRYDSAGRERDWYFLKFLSCLLCGGLGENLKICMSLGSNPCSVKRDRARRDSLVSKNHYETDHHTLISSQLEGFGYIVFTTILQIGIL